MIKEEVTTVRVYAENGYFKVNGSFDLGYIGVFKDDQIYIDGDSDEIRAHWENIEEKLDTDSCTDDEIAAYLTDYINGFEGKVQKNIKLVNNEFLYSVYDWMIGTGTEYWEHEELTVSEAVPDDPDFDHYKQAYDAQSEVLKDLQYFMPNDGSVQKPDVEAFIRKYLPTFHLDNFIKGIISNEMTVHDSFITFDCDDDFDQCILCCASDEITEKDLTFRDWHNF